MFGLNKKFGVRGALVALLTLFVVGAFPATARVGYLIEEVDGTPAGFVYKLKVPNDSLTLSGSVGTLVVAGSGGDLLADGTVPLTANWDVGAYILTGLIFASDQATGTAPFTVASTTVVANLNVSFLEGEGASAFEDVDAAITKSDEAEVLSANWVNTANPWADNEVADNITLTNIAQVADISASASEINTPLDGASVALTEFRELEAIGATTISANQWALVGGLAETLTAAEVNILDGVTGVTAAELSYIGDVTGLIQAQINGLVSSAGDCASGACLDGTSDGGTYLRIHDGDSHYQEFNPGNLAANQTIDLTDFTGTGSWARAASPVFTTNITTPQITLTGSDASPDAAGEMRYDSTIAGMSGGGIRWFDDDSVRLLVDLEIDPSDDDFVVTYDADADGFYMKADADTGGNTDYENIGDPGANGSIDMTEFTGTYTSGTEAWGGMIIESTDADNAGDTTLLTLAHDDDFDTNSVFLHLINDADGGADDLLKVTGLGFYLGAASPTQSMTGDDMFISGFLEVDGPIYADGGLVAASADPKAILDDTGGADGFWAVQAADADDAVATFGVDDSGGDDQPYLEFDGVNERIETKENLFQEADGDFGDFDMTSVDRLEGFDAAIYLDMGADTKAILAADGTVEILVSDEDLTFADGGANQIDIGSNSGVDTIDFGAISLVTTGAISSGSLTPVTDSTADFAANFTGANLYGGTFIANADDGDLVLPSIAAGMNFCVIALGVIEIVAEVSDTDNFLADGVQLDNNDGLTSPGAAGDIACFQYYDADTWLATTNTWTDED